VDNTGYGVMRCAKGMMGLESGIVRVHRFSYFHHNGSFPQKMQIDHVCRNRLCIEISHLKMVGPQEHGSISQRDQRAEGKYRGFGRDELKELHQEVEGDDVPF
jgi:hypothetical protein